mmetsp:Transcript_46904/g.63639  ORF Transcript_46904/g.63639 Transcript_46904/m.63639 type:complete len:89 (-) Transcript_46904:1026-1292(-)|eukprot:CAMPEP_0176378094 /NCGR_PEP_ID=MMETSP0126-20121128/29366_1 /TAXON_ID=141414 ORGANISM="Strombidinopsis acuminatum, Strain SPMC142" /NCGR_SAMPLE_ID=MMETSP0126 /ASSEMBLY_ACC=CAM_ASM_000229 /LENGTH=88 /DNA_ID=CAMNT_0017740231 /DNA_START=312 /DNA_END=578 /DNA_ORIENTATION=+
MVSRNERHMEFFIDFKGSFQQHNVSKAMIDLCKVCHDVTSVGSAEVPWFPTQISDLNNLGKRILSEGDGIQEADHPGFKDPEYRKRRE